MAQRNDVLVWLDYEMTGLDPKTCSIVQMALVLTDTNLEEIAPALDLTIWQPDSVLETMSPFVRRMHQKTGLLEAVRKSDVDLVEAERQALEIVSAHAAYGKARLCGNSIWQDRRFMIDHMPALDNYLHYRLVDVSTLKELGSWWHKLKFPKPDEGKHTAMHDIRQSIAELEFYREKLLR